MPSLDKDSPEESEEQKKKSLISRYLELQDQLVVQEKTMQLNATRLAKASDLVGIQEKT